MPEGQFTGQKCTYEYVADTGDTYLLTLDETLGALTENGLVLASETSTATPRPQSFTPRYVLWVSDAPVGTNKSPSRKKLFCGTQDAPLYGTNVSQALTIDGIAGRITGRIGEKQSFLNICQPPTP